MLTMVRQTSEPAEPPPTRIPLTEASASAPTPAPSATEEMNTHRMEWKAKRTVMEAIIQAGGVIFGGAVRDWYIHDYYASKYYRAFQEAVGVMEDAKEENAEARAEADASYSDETVIPELKDRLVIPNDIDAVLAEAKVSAFVKTLKEKGFFVMTQFRRDAKRYLPHLKVEEGDVLHQRFKIEYIQKDCIYTQLKKAFPAAVAAEPAFAEWLREATERMKEMVGNTPYSFTLDLMMPREGLQIDPPFGGLDFECNGLLLDKMGMRLSDAMSGSFYYGPMGYYQFYNRILRDIREHRAVFPYGAEVSAFRVSKMIQRGWTISNFHTVEYKNDPAYDGYCIICHDTLGNKHYKMRCCDARFHTGCLLDALRKGGSSLVSTGNCIMCKHARCSRLYEEDAKVLEAIVEATKPRALPVVPFPMLPPLPLAPPPIPFLEDEPSEDEIVWPTVVVRRLGASPQDPPELQLA